MPRTAVALGLVVVVAAAFAVGSRGRDSASATRTRAGFEGSDVVEREALHCARETSLGEISPSFVTDPTLATDARGASKKYLAFYFPTLTAASVVGQLQVRYDVPPVGTRFGYARVEYALAGRTLMGFDVISGRGRYIVENFEGCTEFLDAARIAAKAAA